MRVARFAGSRAGAAAIFGWGFAEALSWPLIPEFALAVVVVAAPRKALRLAVLAALGSLAGGAVMYLLAAHGWTPPALLTTARMHSTVATQFAAGGAHAMAHQPLSGIPYKVYGAAAGHAGVGLWPFLAASATARGLRIVSIGLILGGFGALTRRWRRWYPLYLALFGYLFAAGLAGILVYWSRS